MNLYFKILSEFNTMPYLLKFNMLYVTQIFPLYRILVTIRFI